MKINLTSTLKADEVRIYSGLATEHTGPIPDKI